MNTALATVQDPRELAVLKAVGFDRLSPEQRELGLTIAKRYELDPLLKHIVMIEGRAYITRDGLLHIAHRSGQLDGIETTEPAIIDGFWRASCSVYRKDMSRPFTYTGRYPTQGGNQKFAPEMAVKVAEVMALRRAFDVAAPTAEERWDVPETAEAVASASAAAPSLAERAAAKRAELNASTREASDEPPVEAETADGGKDEPPAPAPTTRTGTPEAAGASSAEPTAVPSAPPLSKRDFLAKLADAGIDQNHASVVRLVLFPDASKELTDVDRGVLWEQLEAERLAAV